MNRQIDYMREYGVFDFFGEHAQAAELGERARLVLIARCLDDANLDLQIGRNFFQRGDDVIRLPLRQRRAASPDHNFQFMIYDF